MKVVAYCKLGERPATIIVAWAGRHMPEVLYHRLLGAGAIVEGFFLLDIYWRARYAGREVLPSRR